MIACHTKAEFDAQMAKAKEAGKLVRTRPPLLVFSDPPSVVRLVISSVFLSGAKLLRGFVALG